MSKILFTILLLPLLFTNSFAQVDFGADIYSRYIWRGVDYGNSPSFQPSLSYSYSGITFGTWGAYSFEGEGDAFSEHDLFIQYIHSTESGNYGIIFTDYYYPGAGLQFFNYKGSGNGAHVLEAGLTYFGPDVFPITFAGFYNFHNDPQKSAYFQTGYPVETDAVLLNFFAGASLGKSSWYGTDNAAFINVGITASKSLKFSDEYSLPVYASYIINPDLEQSYLIFGFHL
jgi:hypothetical protein